MKIFKLPKLAELSTDGEHSLSADGGAHGLRFAYGRLHKDLAGKRLSFPQHAEGYFYVIKGNVTVKTPRASFLIGPGEAFYSKDGTEFTLDNSCNSTVEYIFAVAPVSKEHNTCADAQTKPPQAGSQAKQADAGADKTAEPGEDDLLITKDDADPSGISN